MGSSHRCAVELNTNVHIPTASKTSPLAQRVGRVTEKSAVCAVCGLSYTSIRTPHVKCVRVYTQSRHLGGAGRTLTVRVTTPARGVIRSDVGLRARSGRIAEPWRVSPQGRGSCAGQHGGCLRPMDIGQRVSRCWPHSPSLIPHLSSLVSIPSLASPSCSATPAMLGSRFVL